MIYLTISILVTIAIFLVFHLLFLWRPYVPTLVAGFIIHQFQYNVISIFAIPVVIVVWGTLNLGGAYFWHDLQKGKPNANYILCLLSLMLIEIISYTSIWIIVSPLLSSVKEHDVFNSSLLNFFIVPLSAGATAFLLQQLRKRKLFRTKSHALDDYSANESPQSSLP